MHICICTVVIRGRHPPPLCLTPSTIQEATNTTDLIQQQQQQQPPKCQTTYQCCKLAIPRRHLVRMRSLPGFRVRSRLIRHFELRENNQNWRTGSACLKWCPVQSSQDCAADELPASYEPPPRETAENESVVGGEAEATTDGLSDTVTEVPGNEVPAESTTEPEEEAHGEPVPGENCEAGTQQGGPEDCGSEIVDVPVDQTLSIGSRRIIKVPCNGNAKPDRTGVCRAVW